MNGATLYSIGDLARRTGLTAKTIRFYSDCGIVVPTDCSPAGYRLYDIATVTRLDLVRTLRDLGLDLATIRKVVDQELSLPEAAAAHAEALTAHYAHIVGRPDDLGLRSQRYMDLLAVVNGWPAPENLIPVIEWPIEALRARVPA
ncbi:MerR family transcriptional regulator [Streptomyces roseoverticillatus]